MSSNGPPTLLFLQAHPDDECILTGATLAKADSLGFRTIVLYGTRGDAGETNQDLGGESLGERRVREATTACDMLGVDRIEWLSYADSGMAGTDTTANPDAFSNSDPAVVAADVVELLIDEKLTAVVGYDSNGTYGHPDHVQVHRLAHALADRQAAPWVLDATYHREYLAALPDSDGSLDPNFAAAQADLTHFVEGDEWLQRKVKALASHQSQVPDDWDTEKPDIEGFRVRFGTEWYISKATGPNASFESLQLLFEEASFEDAQLEVSP